MRNPALAAQTKLVSTICSSGWMKEAKRRKGDELIADWGLKPDESQVQEPRELVLSVRAAFR